MNWETALDIHTKAAASLLTAAEKISAEHWHSPLAEGKWSAGQIVEHLNVTYDVLRTDLEGGTGMKVVTSFFQRIALRFTVLPKILQGTGFPAGVRAPRELRPAEAADKDAALATFRERSARFLDLAKSAHAQGRKVSHAYFGKGSVLEAVALSGRHVDHHRMQLE